MAAITFLHKRCLGHAQRYPGEHTQITCVDVESSSDSSVSIHPAAVLPAQY